MEYKLHLGAKSHTPSQLIIHSAFCKKNEKETVPVLSGWDKGCKDAFHKLKNSDIFKGTLGDTFFFSLEDGTTVLALGLGEKTKLTSETVRKEYAKLYKSIKGKYTDVSVQLDTFTGSKVKVEDSLYLLVEAFGLASYSFDTYLSKKQEAKLKKVHVDTASKSKKLNALMDKATNVVESVNVARDFVNEPPNVLHSVSYAKMVEKDVKGLKRVKTKILGKPELKKEKMGMFLSVNAGSAHDARLVHLTYTPKKVTKNTKHVILVGKGLTFDTGGYSLKPGGSMMNMKFDMAGSATVYGAFRAAVLNDSPIKITCLLGMTDNAVNEHATMPDSIVKARNGKTVEILNTDAEGRLVLGDVLSYASDLKPDAIIDAATLTGAVLMALGTEVCGVMGNNQKLCDDLVKTAKETDEYAWQLPIIDQWRDDMKSNIADLKNIGGSRWAGSAKAAAFLENFVGKDIAWAHLDIAGCGDSQGHLPYCPPKGASGTMIRTLVNYLMKSK
ncbi:MAG: leucyl aminopeptidase [Bacteriovoracaceae bacterium]